MPPQPDLPHPAHIDADSMLSRKFGKEVSPMPRPLLMMSHTDTGHQLFWKRAAEPGFFSSQRTWLPVTSLKTPYDPFHVVQRFVAYLQKRN